ncbi:hypothetical protein LMH87_007507 [Akanthomyces muscarius]|uniref:Uncharacterized protein n=1 Tax=Akanthomyces muscarius TaxID=2231603 RepID=A0A9W8QQX1_AKAMU|nr:hypothetical protein LMH87_007507 [Akanthomyces muscarius]KAJ4165898.1 hypothetical protein LMH87_007507 [Akanthomyces muscarius]
MSLVDWALATFCLREQPRPSSRETQIPRIWAGLSLALPPAPHPLAVQILRDAVSYQMPRRSLAQSSGREDGRLHKP